MYIFYFGSNFNYPINSGWMLFSLDFPVSFAADKRENLLMDHRHCSFYIGERVILF